jgi:hypothetical protein
MYMDLKAPGKPRQKDNAWENKASVLKFNTQARNRWLTAVILATQEAEIRRILIQSQPGEIVLETLSRKPFTKIVLVN